MASSQDFQNAVNWAIEQEEKNLEGKKINVKNGNKINKSLLVRKVREYFNQNNIEYATFSYQDLIPYLLQLFQS